MALSFRKFFPFLSFYFFTISAEIGFGDQCVESRCGNNGPAIRFPFRIKGTQPERCGYNSSFDLYCTERNQSMLQLPSSVKLFVKNIDYKSQVITVSHPENCFVSQLANLNISASPFLYKYPYWEGYTLFNCPVVSEEIAEKRRIKSVGNFTCLDHAGFQVVAFYSDEDLLTTPLMSCHKMYSTFSVPYYIFNQNADVSLSWTDPHCRNCEAQGGKCTPSEYSSESQPHCVRLHNKVTGSSKGNPVLAGEILGPLVFIFIVVAIYHYYKWDKMERQSYKRIKRFLEDYKALKPARYSYADIKRITNQFNDELGQGAYGTVFKGTLSTDIQVAVKVLNNSTKNGEEFINEMETMCQIHHVNVVRLVGFCADGLRRALVYEFLENGSLKKFISSADTKDVFLGWERLQDIAIGIAKGIEYLHQGCDKRILHFDIKPHNILLDHNFTPKISDFGLAKLCSKDQSIVSMTTARGTMGYIAPEVFSRNFGNVSYKSDVYSYGMLLLEMVGGRKITDGKNSGQVYYPQWIYNLLENNEDIKIHIEGEDTGIARKLSIVGLWCIQWHPVNRPTMKAVVQMLEGDEGKLDMPPNPFASTAPTKASSSVRPDQKLSVIFEIE